MATTQTATEEESTRSEKPIYSPGETGLLPGFKYYGKRAVTTPIGRWLALALMVAGVGAPSSSIGIVLAVAFGIVSSAMVLWIYAHSLAIFRGEVEADDA